MDYSGSYVVLLVLSNFTVVICQTTNRGKALTIPSRRDAQNVFLNELKMIFES